MKIKLKVLGFVCLISLVIALFALTAFAEFENEWDSGIEIQEIKPRLGTKEFGTQDYAYTWLWAPEFTQNGSQDIRFSADGYYWKNSGENTLRAQLKLPSGVDIHDIRLFYYDNNAINISMEFYRANTDMNTITLIGPQNFSTQEPAPHYGTVGFDPNIIFDNYDLYYIRVVMPVTDNSLRFKGIRIAYVRTISPAPLTATFSDVPTTHPFFAEIEALAASGITTGFPDGTYRPSNNVTRQAMAAFLARALGLHHPDPWFY